MPYDKPIYIYVDTYREARITAIQLFAHNGYDTNIYLLTKEEWENNTPFYVKVWQQNFIIKRGKPNDTT